MTTVYTWKGEALELGEQLGSPGGEGTTFRLIRDSSLCAKIYHAQTNPEKRNELRRKLEVMISAPPADPTLKQYKVHSFAWPQQLLFSDQMRQSFCGFVMPVLDLKRCVPASAYIDFTGRRASWTGSWEHLLASARNFASVVEALHRKQHVIGDINDKNIFIGNRGFVSLIDCDSFQIRNPSTGEIFRCNVGVDEYQPPEYTSTGATIETDLFAMAILIFRLLMQGTHPYAARGSAVEHASSSRDKILIGKFPYQTAEKNIEPPPHALPFEVLPHFLRQLFLRCFREGNRDPHARPSAAEWKEVLDEERKNLRRCKKQNLHVYTKELKQCPWCRQIGQGKDDPFPEAQIPVANESRWWQPLRHAAPQSGGTNTPPQLKVDRVQTRFHNVPPGQLLQGNIQISNVGGGVLEGKLTTSAPWIALSTKALDPSRHRQEIGFRVSTVNWVCGMQDQATITITTNGGTEQIPIQVSIENPAPVRKRLQTHVILPSTLFFTLCSILVAAALTPRTGFLFSLGICLLALLLSGVRGLIRKHALQSVICLLLALYLATFLYSELQHQSIENPAALSAIFSAVGMFFALYSALMLLEKKLLTFTARRYRWQTALIIFVTALTLAGAALLPVQTQTAQQLPAPKPTLDGSPHLSLCQRISANCNCKLKSTFRRGDSVYLLLTGSGGMKTTGYIDIPSEGRHAIVFGAPHKQGTESCTIASYRLSPEMKSGIYSGQLQITDRQGEKSTAAFSFSVTR